MSGWPFVDQTDYEFQSSRGPLEITEGDEDRKIVPALTTDSTLGATGAAGDYLKRLMFIPASVSPGAVSIKDGSSSAISVFAGGTSSLADLKAWCVDLGIQSTAGAWTVTTGSHIAVLAIGDFA